MEELKDKLGIIGVMTKYAAGIDTLNFNLYSSYFVDKVELYGFGGNNNDGSPRIIKRKLIAVVSKSEDLS
tara:strand:+ start:637 stop:846 length:210 start_codon:yes stop_codon:yes gene_type:complete